MLEDFTKFLGRLHRNLSDSDKLCVTLSSGNKIVIHDLEGGIVSTVDNVVITLYHDGAIIGYYSSNDVVGVTLEKAKTNKNDPMPPANIKELMRIIFKEHGMKLTTSTIKDVLRVEHRMLSVNADYTFKVALQKGIIKPYNKTGRTKYYVMGNSDTL